MTEADDVIILMPIKMPSQARPLLAAVIGDTSVSESAEMWRKLLLASFGELGFAHGERRAMRLRRPVSATPRDGHLAWNRNAITGFAASDL
jgi:hypothetical protein